MFIQLHDTLDMLTSVDPMRVQVGSFFNLRGPFNQGVNWLCGSDRFIDWFRLKWPHSGDSFCKWFPATLLIAIKNVKLAEKGHRQKKAKRKTALPTSFSISISLSVSLSISWQCICICLLYLLAAVSLDNCAINHCALSELSAVTVTPPPPP